MANLTRIGRSRVWQQVTGPGGSPPTDGVYRTQSRTSTDAKTGSKNPNWRNQIRRVSQAGTPYSRTLELFGFVSGQVDGSFHNSVAPVGQRTTIRAYGELFLDSGPTLPSLPNVSALDIQARVNFLKKCRSTQRAFQGGVFLGELREAVHMIIRPASALRRSISSYSAAAKKAVRRAKGPHKAKALSGTWLEASYGWRPLFNDIDAGMAALADTSHLVPDVIVGVAKDEWRTSPAWASTVISGTFLNCDASFRTRFRGMVRYLGCVAWESENRAGGWQSHWGLTLSDFAPTIWELIPYSFLVDYFSNIGAIIDASSFGAVAVRWGVRSTVAESSVELGNYSPSWHSSSVSQATQSASLGLSPLSRFSFNRGLFSTVDVGIADIRFQVPGIGNWQKWANMAALAVEKVL